MPGGLCDCYCTDCSPNGPSMTRSMSPSRELGKRPKPEVSLDVCIRLQLDFDELVAERREITAFLDAAVKRSFSEPGSSER
jgi:hypothetical protein